MYAYFESKFRDAQHVALTEFEEKGRGLQAKRNIEPGTLLLRELPLVCALHAETLPVRCSNPRCWKLLEQSTLLLRELPLVCALHAETLPVRCSDPRCWKLLEQSEQSDVNASATNQSRCSRCRSCYYCSRSCQRTHWKEHKFVCQRISKLAANDKRHLAKHAPTSSNNRTHWKEHKFVCQRISKLAANDKSHLAKHAPTSSMLMIIALWRRCGLTSVPKDVAISSDQFHLFRELLSNWNAFPKEKQYEFFQLAHGVDRFMFGTQSDLSASSNSKATSRNLSASSNSKATSTASPSAKVSTETSVGENADESNAVALHRPQQPSVALRSSAGSQTESKYVPTMDLDDVATWFARFWCNSVSIFDGELKPFASGIFPAISMTNHSCDPNCVLMFSEAQPNMCHLRSLRPISKGEELTIAYCNLGVPRATRQKELEEGYMFTCKCPRCSRTESLDRLWKGLEKDDVASKVDDLKQRAAKAMARGAPAKAVELLQEATAAIDSRNRKDSRDDPSVYEVLVALSSAQIACGRWQSAFATCERLLPFMEQCYDARSPTLGLQLMLHGKLAWFLELTERAIQLYERAHLILSVSHGKSHSLVEDLVQKMGEARAELIHKQGTKEDRRKLIHLGKLLK